jgi:hypothetical protein
VIFEHFMERIDPHFPQGCSDRVIGRDQHPVRVESNQGPLSYESFFFTVIKNHLKKVVFIEGSGAWIRTKDLQVMSLTSYRCSTPHQSQAGL